MWNINDYGYFSKMGISVFRIKNIFDDKITIEIFPLDPKSSIDWGMEKTYEDEYQENLRNRFEYSEYKYQTTRMFFDYIFRNNR